MPSESAFAVEGLVIEARANGTCEVELANGHRLLGYVKRRDKPQCGALVSGCRVRLKLSPCDLSKGRITGKV